METINIILLVIIAYILYILTTPSSSNKEYKPKPKQKHVKREIDFTSLCSKMLKQYIIIRMNSPLYIEQTYQIVKINEIIDMLIISLHFV